MPVFPTLWIRLCRSFLADQRGAGYSVSVLLILPIYIIALTFAVELWFMGNAYLSVIASKEAASRAVRSWAPQRKSLEDHGSSLEVNVHQAVVRSMVPFASVGRMKEGRDQTLDPALKAVGLKPKSIDRFGKKYAKLDESVRVKVKPTPKPKRGYEVEIQYEVPLFFSFFAPIFSDHQGQHGPCRVITQHQFVPFSKRKMATEDFGIPYFTLEANRW